MTIYECKECGKALSIAEFLERWCDRCRKDIVPVEKRKAA